MSKDRLEHLRGMSEPFPFSFNVIKSTDTIICHAVVFTSYEVRDGEAKIGLLAEDSDPRMPDLLKFLWRNYLNRRRTELEDALKQAGEAKSVLEAELIGKSFGEKHK